MRVLPVLLTVLALGVGGIGTAAAQPAAFDLDALPPCDFTQQADFDNFTVGAVVLNLRTGRGCTENLDEIFHVASVPKLFVAGAYLEYVADGRLSFDIALPFDELYWMGGNGDCLTQSDVGTRVPMGTLSELMISCSDNAATWMLMDAIGWDAVQTYIDGTGISGIGPVIPYAEVDRRKLALIDPQWSNVPRALASRFYRARETDGLAAYFNPLPDYSREQRIAANMAYFEQYTTNTATPRALAEYLLQLSANATLPDDDPDGRVARWLFNTMLLTQRQYTAQHFPGTVTVGAKNGYDMGLTAEVNVLFSTLANNQRVPTAISVVFVRHNDLRGPNVQLFGRGDNEGVLNRYLRDLSPSISMVLFPFEPTLSPNYDPQVSSVVANHEAALMECWQPFGGDDPAFWQLDQLEPCWAGLGEPPNYNVGDRWGVGVILRRLRESDARVTLVYTRPDGTRRSYQLERFYQDESAMFWFHPFDAAGTWTLEVFLNQTLVSRRSATVY